MSKTKKMVEGVFFRAQQVPKMKKKPKYDLFTDICWHVAVDKNTKFEIVDDHEVVTVEIAMIGRLKGKVIEKAMKKFLKGNADLVVNGGESSDGRVYAYTFVITNLQNKKEKMLSLKEAAERWDDRRRPTTLIQEQCEEDDKAEAEVPSHVEKEVLSDNNIAAKKMEEFFAPTPNEKAAEFLTPAETAVLDDIANKVHDKYSEQLAEIDKFIPAPEVVKAANRALESGEIKLEDSGNYNMDTFKLATKIAGYMNKEKLKKITDPDHQKKIKDEVRKRDTAFVKAATMGWQTFHAHATVVSVHPYGAAEDSEPSTSVCVVDKEFFDNHTASAHQFHLVYNITPACFYNNATVYLNGNSYTIKEVYNDLEEFSQFVLIKND